MAGSTKSRLFDSSLAFEHPVTQVIVGVLVVLLVITPIVIEVLYRKKRIPAPQYQELWKRYFSWLVLVPLMVVPVLLGAAWYMAAVALLSFGCFFEFSRALGSRSDRLVNLVVLLGIAFITFAVFDHWYGFFTALMPLTVCLIAAVAILADKPAGYLQRVAVGVLAFMLFGSALGHWGYLANDSGYRPVVLMLLLCVEMNDIFAYCCGKLFGSRKLAPNTSPNKTIGGALGALVLTTASAALLGHFVFQGTEIDHVGRLIAFGVIVSVAGQMGDLLMSSVKRDLGIKDMGTLLPGHGGLLDRFDSILLVGPAAFHFIAYYNGVGLTEPARIFSGG